MCKYWNNWIEKEEYYRKRNIEFGAENNDIMITYTFFFKQHTIILYTWATPDGKNTNNYIAVKFGGKAEKNILVCNVSVVSGSCSI